MQPQLSVVDILYLPEQKYAADKLDRKSRIAVLMPKDAAARKELQFYETVCLNRGWQVKIFNTKQEALAWLKHDL
jgi:hypothetical protein